MANQLRQQQLLQEIEKIITKIDSLTIYVFNTSELFVSGTPIEIIERLKNTNIKILELQKMLPDILQSYIMIPSIGESFNDDINKICQMNQKQNYKAKLLDQNLEEMHNQTINCIDKASIPEKLEMLEIKKKQYNSLIDQMLEFK